ncbi:hypothetical protein DFS34DRAFT_576562 [Phlyctochytrium arcticum]|nr:hypothetical protein DFS34DRAFT_576562 [Phlyctochytrium arcticum]
MPVTTALITPPLSIPSTSSSKQPAASDYVSEPSSSLRSTPYPQAVVHRCAWILNDTSLCARPFTDPEALYTHLTEFHVGRKNAGNLCLHCRVMGCTQNTTAFTKRDHITSHLRSHVPLKANPCESCAKSFKWPVGNNLTRLLFI